MAAEHSGRQPAAVSRSSRSIASSAEQGAEKSIPPTAQRASTELQKAALARRKSAEDAGGRRRFVATRFVECSHSCAREWRDEEVNVGRWATGGKFRETLISTRAGR